MEQYFLQMKRKIDLTFHSSSVNEARLGVGQEVVEEVEQPVGILEAVLWVDSVLDCV